MLMGKRREEGNKNRYTEWTNIPFVFELAGAAFFALPFGVPFFATAVLATAAAIFFFPAIAALALAGERPRLAATCAFLFPFCTNVATTALFVFAAALAGFPAVVIVRKCKKDTGSKKVTCRESKEAREYHKKRKEEVPAVPFNFENLAEIELILSALGDCAQGRSGFLSCGNSKFIHHFLCSFVRFLRSFKK